MGVETPACEPGEENVSPAAVYFDNAECPLFDAF